MIILDIANDSRSSCLAKNLSQPPRVTNLDRLQRQPGLHDRSPKARFGNHCPRQGQYKRGRTQARSSLATSDHADSLIIEVKTKT